MAGKKHAVTGSRHEISGGGDGRTAKKELTISRDLSACTNFRIGGGGGGHGEGGDGNFEDDWKERPAGVGPWPLFEQSREGRASLEEKQGIINKNDRATGAGNDTSAGRLSSGGVEKAKTTAAQPEAADLEVSIGNITTMQASRLRALREKMERRYWPRGMVSGTASTATLASHLVSKTSTSATVPEGPKSLDRPAYLGHSQAVVTKPWGSRQGITAHRPSSGAMSELEDSSRPLWNIGERM